MVEGSNFIKLDTDEVFPKISLLAENKETIKIWKKGNDSQFYRVSDIKRESDTIYMFVFSEGGDADQKIIGNNIFMSFEVNDVDYFTEADIVKKDENLLSLNLNHDIYRSEKRTNERLLTFPHHQVYAYFKITSAQNIGENVISIKKNEDQSYDAYKKAQKERLLEELAKKIDDVSDLAGFRALDVSKTGIAFLVGKDERDYFQQGKLFDFILLFNGEVINLRNGKLVYNIDFVSPRSNVDARFKVGLNFNPDPDLSQKIDIIIHESNSLGAIQKEFEQFVDE